MEFTLNSPLTEEDLDKVYDVDMDSTDSVTFHTKHGKEVEFVKPVRCKNCQCFDVATNGVNGFCNKLGVPFDVYDYCSLGERKDGEQDG